MKYEKRRKNCIMTALRAMAKVPILAANAVMAKVTASMQAERAISQPLTLKNLPMPPLQRRRAGAIHRSPPLCRATSQSARTRPSQLATQVPMATPRKPHSSPNTSHMLRAMLTTLTVNAIHIG